jgi:NAD(P)-dependent dehydrogenase (short-subunit alcohol dehydrogenase family)
MPDMSGKRVLVTGASSGIGRAIAEGLARMNAHVLMVARDERRGLRARDQIRRRSGNERVELLLADLSTRDAIRGLAAEVRDRCDRLDVLINNAAILTGTRRTTPEGYEMQFFVNHVAYYMLTCLLADLLRASAPARIVNVASTAHQSGIVDLNDLGCERGTYSGWQAYANTKLMNVMFTFELARRLEGSGVTANCVHPGVIHTNLLNNYSWVLSRLFHALRVFFKQPSDGADTPLYLAADAAVEGVNGRYFARREPVETAPGSRDRDLQRRLWDATSGIAGCAID